jgi:hypothetical protein
MRYAMLICGDEDQWRDVPADATQQKMDEIMAWIAKWEQAGKLLPGGAELGYSRDARTIRPGTDGQPIVTDGPYLELKEVVGGFLLVQADDIDEAVAIAATWPMVGPSSSVEVRPVMDR